MSRAPAWLAERGWRYFDFGGEVLTVWAADEARLVKIDALVLSKVTQSSPESLQDLLSELQRINLDRPHG